MTRFETQCLVQFTLGKDTMQIAEYLTRVNKKEITEAKVYNALHRVRKASKL